VVFISVGISVSSFQVVERVLAHATREGLYPGYNVAGALFPFIIGLRTLAFVALRTGLRERLGER
jgi:hypothetical protein